jgi:SSS family solute:Na+ symporter
MLAANTLMLDAAKAAKIPEGTKLIGYDYDAAFPMLLRKLLTPGITWFVLAAIFGAVVSSLASMLNSASTIATIDIYQKLKPKSSQDQLVNVGKFFTVLFVLISCVIAPNLGNPGFGGIFTFIQEFQGFISPGVLMVFLFGFLVPRAPRFLGWLGILVNVLLYGYLYLFQGDIPFLNRMAICFGVVFVVMMGITLVKPLAKPVVLPTTDLIALESSKVAKWGGVGVVIATLLLYVVFW